MIPGGTNANFIDFHVRVLVVRARKNLKTAVRLFSDGFPYQETSCLKILKNGFEQQNVQSNDWAHRRLVRKEKKIYRGNHSVSTRLFTSVVLRLTTSMYSRRQSLSRGLAPVQNRLLVYNIAEECCLGCSKALPNVATVSVHCNQRPDIQVRSSKLR